MLCFCCRLWLGFGLLFSVELLLSTCLCGFPVWWCDTSSQGLWRRPQDADSTKAEWICCRKMRRIKGSSAQKFRSGLWGRTATALGHLWDVYSKPTPAEASEVLELMLLCLAASLVTGGLLYSWMVGTLRYGQVASGAMAGIYGTAAFLLLFFVHPARCMFTMTLPTLGTKQGRKLVLSTAVTVLLLNVVPNISTNMGILSHMFKCTSENMLRSLINSSDVMNLAQGDLIREATKVQKSTLQVVQSLTNWHHFTHINVTGAKQRFNGISKDIETDLSHLSHVLRHIQLLVNRLLAAFFVICLLFESAMYLKSYLTNVKFNNTYNTRKLVSIARAKGLEISPGNMKNLQCSTRCHISQELQRCVPRIAVVTLHFVATIVIVSLDYMVYNFINASKPWVFDLPSAQVSISMDYKVQMFPPAICAISSGCKADLVDFQKMYSWSFSTRPEQCAMDLSEPDLRVVCLLGFLYLVAYSIVFLEVYATRSQSAMASSFFQCQEEKRVQFIYQKILAKEERKNGIYFIKATHGCQPL